MRSGLRRWYSTVVIDLSAIKTKVQALGLNGAGHRQRIQPACCVLLPFCSTKRVANGDLSISFVKTWNLRA